jgi:hypothetical protein
MLNEMKNEFNKARTTNGDHQFNSSLDAVLDLFAKGGAMRRRDNQEVVSLFSKAFSEDAELALKVLFYIRDVRGGQGERRMFRESMKHLAVHDTDSFVKVVKHIPEFGSWKDVVELLDVKSKAGRAVLLDLIHAQVEKDVRALKDEKSVSLAGKWLPSENASSKATKAKARLVRSHLGLDSKRYRKMLSALRKEIDVVEVKMSAKEFSDIDYSKVPTQANMNYKDAFKRNDGERYSEFLDSVVKGEAKINAGTLSPHQIVEKVMGNSWSIPTPSRFDSDTVKFLDSMWKAQVDHIGDDVSNALVMADVSGSMHGTPMHVSIGLGMYIAERNKGRFHNHFMTFDSNPQLVQVQGKNVVEKIINMAHAPWGGSTNLEKAMQKILDIAVGNGLSQEDLPSQLIIISDMQFNQATGSYYGEPKSVTKTMVDRFTQAGYKIPDIVFWNVNATTLPVTKNDAGVALVSGLQPAVMKQIMSAGELDPIGLMMDVVGQERYSVIKL